MQNIILCISFAGNALPGAPLAVLALLGVLTGVLMLWVFARCSDQTAIRTAKARVRAHMLELRLYPDEPAIVLRAQGKLVIQNLLLIGHVLPAVLVMSIPMALLFVYADAIFGRAPLPIGLPAIVTVHVRNGVSLDAVSPKLEVPRGVSVETAALRIPAAGELSWRIVPNAAVSDFIRILTPHGVVAKRIETGSPGLRYLSEERGAAVNDLLFRAGEMPFSDPVIASVEIRYPSAAIGWFGVSFHWAGWFLLFTVTSALLLKKRMGVAF